jgi:hypothetical protein
MPLRIRVKEDALHCPVVVCDLCGKEITDARDGNYQWKMVAAERPGGAVIVFTHKRCCHAFEEKNRAAMWGAMEMECLPIYLGNNLRLDWPEAKRRVAVFDYLR